MHVRKTHCTVFHEHASSETTAWISSYILFSNTEQGNQKQLDGLKTFCNNNKMIVNETKTKVMNFGTKMLIECIL